MRDPDNPLPEPSFLWRRLLSFGTVTACLALIWRLTYVVPAKDALGLCQALLLFSALVVLLYAGGASAADISGILANLKLRRGRPPVSGEPEA